MLCPNCGYDNPNYYQSCEFCETSLIDLIEEERFHRVKQIFLSAPKSVLPADKNDFVPSYLFSLEEIAENIDSAEAFSDYERALRFIKGILNSAIEQFQNLFQNQDYSEETKKNINDALLLYQEAVKNLELYLEERDKKDIKLGIETAKESVRQLYKEFNKSEEQVKVRCSSCGFANEPENNLCTNCHLKLYKEAEEKRDVFFVQEDSFFTGSEEELHSKKYLLLEELSQRIFSGSKEEFFQLLEEINDNLVKSDSRLANLFEQLEDEDRDEILLNLYDEIASNLCQYIEAVGSLIEQYNDDSLTEISEEMALIKEADHKLAKILIILGGK